LAVIIAIAWAGAGTTLKVRAIATLKFIGVAAIVLGACYGIYRYEQRQFEQKVAEQMTKRKPTRWDLLPILKDHGVPARDFVRKVLAERSPGAAAGTIDRRVDRVIAERQARWDTVRARAAAENPGVAADKIDEAAAQRVLAEEITWDQWISVWVPRYLGICWPAFAIVACALLVRLPVAWLRYSMIALLLGVNLAQSAGRVLADTEPPMDKIYTDVVAAQDQLHGQAATSTTRTYFYNVSFMSIGDPGSIGLFGMQARYYATRLTGVDVKPAQFRAITVFLPFEPWRLKFSVNASPLAIAADLEKSPRVDRVVIWEKLPAGWALPQPPPRLPPGWSLASDEQFFGRVHWTWQRMYTLRRLLYVKTAEPLTAPATQPSTTAPATQPVH
jgi:hypothetical protein